MLRSKKRMIGELDGVVLGSVCAGFTAGVSSRVIAVVAVTAGVGVASGAGVAATVGVASMVAVAACGVIVAREEGEICGAAVLPWAFSPLLVLTWASCLLLLAAIGRLELVAVRVPPGENEAIMPERNSANPITAAIALTVRSATRT